MKKAKAGRPRLNITDDERVKRARESVKRSREKLGQKGFALNGVLRSRLDKAKKEQEREFGFKLTNQQFVTMLVTKWEKWKNEEE